MRAGLRAVSAAIKDYYKPKAAQKPAPEPKTGLPTENPKDAIGSRKVPFSVVPANVMAEVAVALLEGASKYGRHNWRVSGIRAGVYYDATMRHLTAWWEGEDADPGSGLSHVTKAIASLIVLRDSMMRGSADDNRPPPSAPFIDAMSDAAASMIDRHADIAPKHWTIADKL